MSYLAETISQINQVGLNEDPTMVTFQVQSQLDTPRQEQLTDIIDTYGFNDIRESQLSEFVVKVAVSQTVGAGKEAFSFNSLDKGRERKFASKSECGNPAYQSLGSGLNLEGECQTTSCVAFKKRVVIPKGYGKFSMHKHVYTSRCPVCQQKAHNVNNLYIRMTEMKMQGMTVESDKVVYNTFVHKDKKGYLEFNWLDNKVVVWSYLQLEVLKLNRDLIGVRNEQKK